MIILTIAPTFPIAIEAIANMMPMTDKINVTVHAHLFPFHNPYVITRYAIPIIKNMIPMPDESQPNSDTKGAATIPEIPLARNTIPPIAVNIAIIVTPKGLCF